jgi:hypothetical protein
MLEPRKRPLLLAGGIAFLSFLGASIRDGFIIARAKLVSSSDYWTLKRWVYALRFRYLSLRFSTRRSMRRDGAFLARLLSLAAFSTRTLLVPVLLLAGTLAIDNVLPSIITKSHWNWKSLAGWSRPWFGSMSLLRAIW